MTSKIEHTNDEVRHKIIHFLAQQRQAARGVSGLSASISEINKALKKENVGRNEVARNLDYLIQHGWVLEDVINRPYTTPKGFQVPSEKRLYKLSDVGLRYAEGESSFDRTSVFSGINITSIGGITVVGNNNIVRNEFMDSLRAFNQLEGAAKVSDQLTEEQKLNIQADIQTIKNQLSKAQPNKSILKSAMEGIAFIGSLPGFAEVFQVAAAAIGNIL
ncbi:MAG: hypothetical protein A2785_04375 [Candidatus Chisholmbacteria bacterium RIFCSPHIGHO2_01_FULL_49_18]|uniref:Uncharacterized protein n=2 Tax=Candidatus Chisholmiibacteriota TaxID=1817900 RepID=A0A1G1VPD6_9BACT|nr:MAG: hypothetical protein A2785_04375 [Candidatus Chisholmbacteria bacterium RIFCSPHIGHO2_01_FULL_49_18]OGY22560.1 MAG: hypothetical protein A3A65_01040 [Candidatus Chisholmbacteria bacterium RIFCSPLOWO2_01_FULL_49_14]